jgi:hypothetical protein
MRSGSKSGLLNNLINDASLQKVELVFAIFRLRLFRLVDGRVRKKYFFIELDETFFQVFRSGLLFSEFVQYRRQNRGCDTEEKSKKNYEDRAE